MHIHNGDGEISPQKAKAGTTGDQSDESPQITIPMGSGGLIPDGMYPATIVGVCDLGEVRGYKDETKRQVALTYRVMIGAECSEITETYTASLAPLSNLGAVIDAVEGFRRIDASRNLGRLAGKSLAVTVVTKEGSRGGEFSVVESVSRLRSGKPPAPDGLVVWSWSSGTPPPPMLPNRVIRKMPEWDAVLADKDPVILDDETTTSPPITDEVVNALWANTKVTP